MIKYSFLQEAVATKSLVKQPTRDPRINRVGDPREVINDPDAPTNKMRRQAGELKAQSELIAAKAQLAQTQYDAEKSMKDLEQRKADDDTDAQQEMAAQQNPMVQQ